MTTANHIGYRDLPFIDRVFEMGSGYVLDFSDRTFGQFFAQALNVNIDDDKFSAMGTSKAKRLRYFLQNVDPRLAAKTLRALLEYRSDLRARFGHPETEAGAVAKVQAVIERLESDRPSTEGIDRFTADQTLEELVASIERDIKADKPQVALDRLHTYCMKKFAHLLAVHGEQPVDGETLNARAGRYFNPIRRARKVRPISAKIMKTTVEVFELFNGVRNNESLAHDNVLIERDEARYIFDAVANLLRFVKSMEGKSYEGVVGKAPAQP